MYGNYVTKVQFAWPCFPNPSNWISIVQQQAQSGTFCGDFILGIWIFDLNTHFDLGYIVAMNDIYIFVFYIKI